MRKTKTKCSYCNLKWVSTPHWRCMQSPFTHLTFPTMHPKSLLVALFNDKFEANSYCIGSNDIYAFLHSIKDSPLINCRVVPVKVYHWPILVFVIVSASHFPILTFLFLISPIVRLIVRINQIFPTLNPIRVSSHISICFLIIIFFFEHKITLTTTHFDVFMLNDRVV